MYLNEIIIWMEVDFQVILLHVNFRFLTLYIKLNKKKGTHAVVCKIKWSVGIEPTR